MNLNKIQNKTIVSIKKPPSQKVLNPELELYSKQIRARGHYQPSGSHKKSLVKDICEEMLINGNIDSFVNFFYLTHTTENPNEEKDELKKNNEKKSNKNEDNEDSEDEERKYFEIEMYNENNIKESKNDLNKNKLNTDNLFNFNTLFVKIEECEKNDNVLEGYSAKKNLAEYFGRLNNWNEAIRYYQKAYESILLLKNKVELHLEAIYNIGHAFEKNNQTVKALAYYTKCREVSIAELNKSYELIASKKIVKLRLIVANKLDKKKKYEKEIEHYKKCIKINKESYDDKNEINAISFRLGTAYYNNNNLDKAISLFEEFINNSDDSSKNIENKRLAHASIADCYVSKNDFDKAIEHLEKFISYGAKDIKQKNGQIEALNKLGIIYNKRGEYKKAVGCFEKHFQLLNALKEESESMQSEKEKLNSKKSSLVGIATTSKDNLLKIEEENYLNYKKALNESMDPLFVNESRSNLSNEKGEIPTNGIVENSKKFNEALIQMGVAKADTELERFFSWVQKSDTPSLKSLLQWKANRTIVEYGDDNDIIINTEKETEDLLHNKNENTFNLTENDENNNEIDDNDNEDENENENKNENINENDINNNNDNNNTNEKELNNNDSRNENKQDDIDVMEIDES